MAGLDTIESIERRIALLESALDAAITGSEYEYDNDGVKMKIKRQDASWLEDTLNKYKIKRLKFLGYSRSKIGSIIPRD
jgi:hypothetical protein